jgi:hypothetical protein
MLGGLSTTAHASAISDVDSSVSLARPTDPELRGETKRRQGTLTRILLLAGKFWGKQKDAHG